MSPALIQELGDEEPTAPLQEIKLTPVEATLRQLLLDVANYIDNAPADPNADSQVKLPQDLEKQKIILRFTGGWVRDKLLGVPSHDIDVAINKMTGYQFGLRLKEYLEISGSPEKYGLEGVATTDKQNQKAGTADKSKVVGGLHKIEANPEKSKHLETVTTKILGLDIDLVNLRKETYTDDSRNPAMEFGTPEEDALRRDATVNAMFYNINTQEIEDFTGRGHDDMLAKILRTPLEPYQTFKDDPLRILRLIRFASRLDYEIDVNAKEAMKDAGIKDALRRKISRERVGIELEKALTGNSPRGPFTAMLLINELDLYETIFSDPTVTAGEAYEPVTDNWHIFVCCLFNTINQEKVLAQMLMRDDEERFLAWQMAAMVPYNDAPQQEPSDPGRKPPPPIAAQVAREGIKATNKVCEIIAASVRNQMDIAALVDKLKIQRQRPDRKVYGEDAMARDVLGMAIRRWGSNWRTMVMYSMLVELARDSFTEDQITQKYTKFLQRLEELDLLVAHTFKPLMDGKALAKALNTAPGPWMKDALDVVMAYQLRNPDTSTAADAIAEVQRHLQAEGSTKQNGGELSHSLIHHFLKLTIRPLFLKTKPASVTDTGRKNTTTILPPKSNLDNTDDAVFRPWKGAKEAHSLDLLRWCVAALDSKVVEGVWHLLIPPLLTLVDDWEVRYKTLGVELVQQVLLVTPPSLLAKTGLGEVFDDALMPCLTYIPTLTPESESVQLLDATYPAVLTLSHIRFSPTTPGASLSSSQQAQRTHFLDTILRKGILHTLTLCPLSEYPVLAALLYHHLATLIAELGIESVKHLKFVLPTLTATLTHPLAAPAAPEWREVEKEALGAMKAVVLAGWPRMGVWRGEVLRGLCGGWVGVVDAQAKGEGEGDKEMEEGLEALKRLMREVVAVLKCAVVGSEVDGETVDWEGECGRLVEVEPKLQGLFDGAELGAQEADQVSRVERALQARR